MIFSVLEIFIFLCDWGDGEGNGTANSVVKIYGLVIRITVLRLTLKGVATLLINLKVGNLHNFCKFEGKNSKYGEIKSTVSLLSTSLKMFIAGETTSMIYMDGAWYNVQLVD